MFKTTKSQVLTSEISHSDVIQEYFCLEINYKATAFIFDLV